MANLIPWEPFRDFLEIGSIFDKFLGRMGRSLGLGRSWDGVWSPAVDVYDEKDSLIVKAELPGVDKKDIKINIDGDLLTIRGQTRRGQEVKDKNYYYSEISYGSFYRTIPLPVPVVKDRVKASYKDGVLTIELPKSEEAKSQGIDIPIE